MRASLLPVPDSTVMLNLFKLPAWAEADLVHVVVETARLAFSPKDPRNLG